MNQAIINKFKQLLPLSQLHLNEPLKNHTTLKIGGPADLFFEAKTEDQLVKAVHLAQKLKSNYFILGWGSNLLISDAGFRGLIIKNLTSDIRLLSSKPAPKKSPPPKPARHEHANHHGKTYQPFSDLDYHESHLPAQLVQVSSGVNLGHLINWTLDHHLTGLQWFSRIPGTVGGAIFNNIHGGTHYIQEYLHQVTVLPDSRTSVIPTRPESDAKSNTKSATHHSSRHSEEEHSNDEESLSTANLKSPYSARHSDPEPAEGEESLSITEPQPPLLTLTPDQLHLGYDRSIFQKNRWTIINTTLRLYQGDVKKARQIVRQWAQRKSHQPSNSAGCTFKNITHQEMAKLRYPTTGVGYIIEHILKWSGKKVGGAMISPQHHNFIVNSGGATARDVLQLIKEIKSEVFKKTGLTLEPEIFFIGFTPQELKGVTGKPI